jgi:AcrR family transcriptional regulator
LFERDGYTATTMAAIAAEAGVALKTVYLAFETKSGLARAVWDVLLRGTADRPVAEQPWYREVLDETDPRRRLELNARNARDVKGRLGGLLAVIREAAAVDDDMAALWQLIETDFYANQRVVVEGLDANGSLRAGLDVTRATDILWTLNHPELWRLLVVVRGWTPDEYEAWFGQVSVQQLVGIP